MRPLRHCATALVAILVLAGSLFAQSTPPTLTIKQVQEVPWDTLISASPTASYSRYVNDTITVIGTVVAAPRFSPGAPTLFALGNAFTMYIVDENGGAWSGLNVRGTDTVASQNTLMTAVDTGFVVKVTGVVTQYFTTTQFEIGKIAKWNANVQIEVLDTKPRRPDPTDVLITDLVTGDPKAYNPSAMQWEGVYVQLKNLRVGTVTKGSNGRYTWTITDGQGHSIGVYDQSKFFRAGADAFDPNWSPPAPGTAITSIRGIMTTSGQGMVIAPIYPGDFVLGSNPPIISNVLRSTVFPKSNEKMTITATIEDSNPGGTVTEAKLTYGIGNGPALGTLDMTLNTGAKTGTVEIPEQADGSAVWYYITAKDDANESTMYPSDTTKSKPFFIVRDGIIRIHEVQYTPFKDGMPSCVGATVAVRGVVTSDTSLTVTFMQDGDAPWSGVLIRGGSDIRALKVGEDVTITGKVAEGYSSSTYGNTAIIDAVVTTKHGTATPPTPVPLTTVVFKTEAVPEGEPSAEQWEGMLLTFKNLTVTKSNADASTGGFYGEFLVSDGTGDMRVDDLGSWKTVYTNDTAKKTLIFLSPGTRIANLTGIMMFNFANYKLEPRNVSDFDQVTDVHLTPALPASVVLRQSHPNPVMQGAVSRITFDLPEATDVTLDVYDLLGKKVTTLVSGWQAAGIHDATFQTGRLPMGVYMIRLNAGGTLQQGRLVISR